MNTDVSDIIEIKFPPTHNTLDSIPDNVPFNAAVCLTRDGLPYIIKSQIAYPATDSKYEWTLYKSDSRFIATNTPTPGHTWYTLEEEIPDWGFQVFGLA